MIRTLALLAAILTGSAFQVSAQTEERRPSHCISLAQAPGPTVHRASFAEPVPAGGVRLRYVDHSMFLLQTSGGLDVVTDYNGSVGLPDFIPDVVTMNHAHSTHWTAFPDPRIPNVLTGWNPEGGGRIDHWLDLGELLVRNVSTDIRSGWSGVEQDGNSIFVFEVEGLCIGHLGHLHHMPSEAEFAALGRLDVVMAPVDGGMTLDLPTMITVLERLRSSIVIPMHWFAESGLQRFLAGMNDHFRIDLRDGPDMRVSIRDLPPEPTIVVLRPRFLFLDD